MIKVTNLTKTYPGGVQALRGVSLELSPKETLAVVGESGCGKSTLARHVLGLEKPTSGSIEVEGRDLFAYSAKERARKIQMVFQDPSSSLNPRRRIGASVSEPLKVARTGTSEERRQKAIDAITRVGLRADAADRFPHMFSGGQRQRIGIARALITGAPYILCDEPVSALDVSIQAQILNLLLELQEAGGLGYLFISHDLGVVRFLADRVAVMYLGRIVETGPVVEIFERPRHPYTRLLLDSTPDPLVPVAEGNLVVAELPSPVRPPPGCAFAGRCVHAVAACRETLPELRVLGPSQSACLRAEELDLSRPAVLGNS